MRRTNCVCGKSFWPNQAWAHKSCGEAEASPVSEVEEEMGRNAGSVLEGEVTQVFGSALKQRWDREKYRSYQREYMRKYRLKKKGVGDVVE